MSEVETEKNYRLPVIPDVGSSVNKILLSLAVITTVFHRHQFISKQVVSKCRFVERDYVTSLMR